MFPLSMTNSEQVVEIIKIMGSSEVKHRLEKMGFVASALVTIFSNNNGNMIIQLLDSKLALSSELSKHIMVKENK